MNDRPIPTTTPQRTGVGSLTATLLILLATAMALEPAVVRSAGWHTSRCTLRSLSEFVGLTRLPHESRQERRTGCVELRWRTVAAPGDRLASRGRVWLSPMLAERLLDLPPPTA